MTNFSKTTWLISVLVSFLIITGMFAHQWWQTKGELAKQIEQNENLTRQIGELQKELEKLKVTKVTEEEKITDALTNWKTYRNEEYEYEVQYPKEWLVKDSTPFGKNHIRFKELGDYNRTVDIRVYDNSGGLPLNQWFDSYIAAHCGVEERESTLTAGVLGIKTIYTCGEFGVRGIFLPKKTQIYNIDFLLGGSGFLVNDKEGIYGQMLSTFSFVEK